MFAVQVQDYLYRKVIVILVIKKLKHRINTLRVGDPLDKNTDVGAINSKMQLNKIKELVESGIDEGCSMYRTDCNLPDKGLLVPTYFFH